MPPRSLFFPPPSTASPEGLIAIGGDLSPERLLDAYRHGIFPWPVYEDDPMLWWSPDPRAILPLDGLQISKRLRRTLRSGVFRSTCDQAFGEVIDGCASAQNRLHNTWLTEEMLAAYLRMHELGHAHSVEVWHDGALAGGTYGLALGGLFAAESMFYRIRDASKIALAYLVTHLRTRGFKLVDVQQWTPHTGRLGVIDIPRDEYLRRSAEALQLDVSFGNQLEGRPID